MARKIAAVVFTLGCLQADAALALGLGDLELDSFLNEPLKASVDLLNLGGLHGDEIKVRLGTREDFDKLGLDRAYFLTSIQFEVVSDGKGGAQVIMTSENPVLEPYLDFVVEARWPSGRLLREYTVLVDPPAFAQNATVVSASERVDAVDSAAESEKKRVSEYGTAGTASTTGTQVDVRRSDLPPGAMPQRGYNSTTAASPSPGSRYMVARDQTLWDIASQARPDGASVHQTMLDIQRLNPDAFINGNINRVKAGYIVYLPTADDISSASEAQALAEVREQNAAWREGRDAQLYASGGPSLSISADDSADEADATGNAAETSAAGATEANEQKTSDAVSGQTTDELGVPDNADTDERVAAMQHQLETLERIITLKDEQIAALQGALAEADGAESEIAGTDASMLDVLESDTETASTDEGSPETFSEAVAVVEEEIEPEVAEPETSEAPTPKAPAATATTTAKPPSTTSPAPESGGWMDYLWYIVGAGVLAILGLVIARRRGEEDNDYDAPVTRSAASAGAGKDVFSDVKLKEQHLEVEADDSDLDDGIPVPAAADKNRGYGERRHDEYASDVDAADALAEADIYIAYGRHPQAIDLLNNALANEPGNPVYRLKLLEIHAELNNYGAATAQLEKLREIGDPDSIARAEALMEHAGTPAATAPVAPAVAPAAKAKNDGPGLPPNPLDMTSDGDLEADFSGLEIEDPDSVSEDADDLDLSADFVGGRTDDFEDEELVIAADSNGLSTKLDLARAYLDMGDDEGARQILDEVVAEGSDELKAEARTLLDRIGD